MGLLSFAKSVGRKLGILGDNQDEEAQAAAAKAAEAKAAADAADEAAAAELRRAAVQADLGAAILSYVKIADLHVAFDGETATLRGTATSQADRERACLVAGNTEGVAAVDDQLAVEVPEPPAIFRTVERGDTLSKIAAEQYGVMRMFDVIFDANRPMLKHPDEIYPGQVLRVPRVGPPVHTVARGETLGGIAKHWYGDARRYTAIFEANRGVLDNPDRVEVGMELSIPVSGPAVA